ncbi:MAG: hypothetical protein HQL50_05150 [Magnetococcales bacterium]|nr:hypothetical protein [Magnetococcales bacterium]
MASGLHSAMTADEERAWRGSSSMSGGSGALSSGADSGSIHRISELGLQTEPGHRGRSAVGSAVLYSRTGTGMSDSNRLILNAERGGVYPLCGQVDWSPITYGYRTARWRVTRLLFLLCVVGFGMIGVLSSIDPERAGQVVSFGVEFSSSLFGVEKQTAGVEDPFPALKTGNVLLRLGVSERADEAAALLHRVVEAGAPAFIRQETATYSPNSDASESGAEVSGVLHSHVLTGPFASEQSARAAAAWMRRHAELDASVLFLPEAVSVAKRTRISIARATVLPVSQEQPSSATSGVNALSMVFSSRMGVADAEKRAQSDASTVTSKAATSSHAEERVALTMSRQLTLER